MPPRSNRSAKQKFEVKIPGLPAGEVQEANGPSQDQEITAIKSQDQLESVNRADQSKSGNSTSSSEDTETEDVDIDSESDDEVPPRSADRAAADDLVNKYHLVLNKNQTRRRQKADEADKKAKQTEVEKVVEASADNEKVEEVQEVIQAKTVAEKVVEV